MLLKVLIRGNHKPEAGTANAIQAKSANQPVSQNTELPALAGIAGLALATEQNEKKLLEIINAASEGLGLKPQSVLNGLLSIEDEKNLLDGSISVACLRAHIASWLFSEMPHISGKNQNNQL